MRKDWRLFVFWLGVGVAGIAIWLSWWAVSGFQVPICQEMSSGASVTDHCLSYDEIRAWGAQISDSAWNGRICKSLGGFDCGALHSFLGHFYLAPMAVHPSALERDQQDPGAC
jgi:hypothetical protein